MIGQLSLFDFVPDPEQEAKQEAERWSAKKPSDKNVLTCERCRFFRKTVDAYTCEPIGTICAVVWPYATPKEPDAKACDKYEEETGKQGEL